MCFRDEILLDATSYGFLYLVVGEGIRRPRRNEHGCADELVQGAEDRGEISSFHQHRELAEKERIVFRRQRKRSSELSRGGAELCDLRVERLVDALWQVQAFDGGRQAPAAVFVTGEPVVHEVLRE